MNRITDIAVEGEDDGGEDKDGNSCHPVEPEAGVVYLNFWLVKKAKKVVIIVIIS